MFGSINNRVKTKQNQIIHTSKHKEIYIVYYVEMYM